MSTTAQDVFYDVRALLDEFTDEGILKPDADVVDLQAKAIRFIDMAQKELYKIGKNYKKFEYTNKPATNLLGLLSNFNIAEFTGLDAYYPSVAGITGAKAYYFEVDGEATVKIQEQEAGAWQDLVTVSVPNTVTSMAAYKGIITPTTAGNPIRMKFSGSYYYKHQNRALYSAPFSASRIPDYRPWVKLALPSDFRAVDVVINEFPERQYALDKAYKWEGFKDLYINYYWEGTIRVVYKPVPTTIDAITDTLEIDDITAKAIAYYVAAKLATDENPSLVSYFEQKYAELKMESTHEMPLSEETVVNLYG